MYQKIKHTFQHTAIYSLGNIATKLVGIVLLPLYTKHITVSEYGILGILEVTLIILTQVLSFGQTSSYLRFYHMEEYASKRKSTLFTIFVFLFIAESLFIGLIWIVSEPLSQCFEQSHNFDIYFKLSAWILFFRVINHLFLTVLRAKEKSHFYVFVNLVRLMTGLGFNIYWVAFAQLGVRGVMLSSMVSEGILVLILIPAILRDMVIKLNLEVLRDSLVFGMPLIFSSLAGMLLNVGDRYIIKLLLNYDQVGLYNLGYKVGSIFNVLLIQSFSLGLLPLVYKAYGQTGDKRYYSKMLTYFALFLLWTFLGLSVFSKEIIQNFTLNSDYWSAYRIVPVISLAYVFSGANWVVSLGLFLKKKTQRVAFNNILVVLLNIGLNFLLIPKLKLIGASIATLISYMTLYLLSYYSSGKYYQIPFENIKLLKMFGLSLLLYCLSSIVSDGNMLWSILIKMVLLLFFPFGLYFLGCYEKNELERIRMVKFSNIIQKFRNR
ncbi:oligosaccharide flippase family protein [bacterium]|nr:oligosaccharide flippase family protein [bacterium]